MRTLLVYAAIALVTPIAGLSVIVAALLGVRDSPGGIFDWAPRVWGRLLLRAGGVRVTVHGAERVAPDRPRVIAANHVSWFDVFVLAAVVPRCKFIAKAELASIPIFGRACRAAGMVFVDRDNRKSAFASYETAVARMREGASVVVCPEGTRGPSYDLRPFKKGPFVLAIAAGAPVVPTVLYGTREIQPKGRWRVRPGHVHIHFLPEVITTGLTYEDRDRVSAETEARMAALLEAQYGVRSERSATPAAAKSLVAV